MISVIVPIYNSEKYIKKCIESILSQTYNNFEIILIDDGSTDNSPTICDEYAKQDNRIKVVHKKNGGVSSSRNCGIKLAKGKYLTFIDSDDYFDNYFLANSIKGINNVDMYLSGLKMELYDGNKIAKTIDYTQSKSSIMTIKELFEKQNITYPHTCICGPWAKLYKTSIIKNKNILFDEKTNLGEDTLFNLTYFKNIKNVFFDKKAYYHYRRINNESLFSSYHPDIYEKHIKVYDTIRNLLKSQNCSKECLNRFEDLYASLLIGCIHHIFKFSKKKTDRINVINKVMNNEYIKYATPRNTIKNKIIVNCLKKKKKNIIFLAFSLKYFL